LQLEFATTTPSHLFSYPRYILFAAEPYETVAFKIPNDEIDKDFDKFISHWSVFS
jgi:hypothetical protein